MATIYTQTIQVSVWKEHVCSCCGCRFRYRFRRTKKGTGGSPDAAAANAERAVVHALQREVDMQPCPACGLYQPDMVAARRVPPHWIITGVGVAVENRTTVFISGALALVAGALSMGVGEYLGRKSEREVVQAAIFQFLQER